MHSTDPINKANQHAYLNWLKFHQNHNAIQQCALCALSLSALCFFFFVLMFIKSRCKYEDDDTGTAHIIRTSILIFTLEASSGPRTMPSWLFNINRYFCSTIAHLFAVKFCQCCQLSGVVIFVFNFVLVAASASAFAVWMLRQNWN